MTKFPTIIAEVKTQSPFGYTSENSWKELFKIAESIGNILSIHTDPRWGGNFELISKAKRLTQKPILAKGIHANDKEIEQAVERGAEYVLVVGRIPGVHLEKCLIEVKSLDQLKEFADKLGGDTKFVWNSRDLDTGGLNDERFDEARKIWSGWLCQASNIKCVDDIQFGADAILVGTNLESFKNSIKTYASHSNH